MVAQSARRSAASYFGRTGLYPLFTPPGSLSRFGGRYKLASQLLLFARAGARPALKPSVKVLSASPFSASPACRPAAARPPPRPASLIKRKASPLEVLAAYAPPAAPLPPCPALEPACLPGSRTLAPASPVPLEPTEFDLPVPRDGAVRKRHVDFLMDVFPEPPPAPRFVESPVCVARWL